MQKATLKPEASCWPKHCPSPNRQREPCTTQPPTMIWGHCQTIRWRWFWEASTKNNSTYAFHSKMRLLRERISLFTTNHRDSPPNYFPGAETALFFLSPLRGALRQTLASKHEEDGCYAVSLRRQLFVHVDLANVRNQRQLQGRIARQVVKKLFNRDDRQQTVGCALGQQNNANRGKSSFPDQCQDNITLPRAKRIYNIHFVRIRYKCHMETADSNVFLYIACTVNAVDRV